MKLNKQVVDALQTQLGILWTAHQTIAALRVGLSAPSAGWQGSHKYFGRRQKEIESDHRKLQHLLLKFAMVKTQVTSVPAISTDADDITKAWETLLEQYTNILDGWADVDAVAMENMNSPISAKAEFFEDDMVDRIEFLNCRIGMFRKAASDYAAQIKLDREVK